MDMPIYNTVSTKVKKHLHVQLPHNPLFTACGKKWVKESDKDQSLVDCKRCKKWMYQQEIKRAYGDPIASQNFTKTCTCCKETKNISEFSLFMGTGDGISIYCKSCSRIKSNENWHRFLLTDPHPTIADTKVCPPHVTFHHC